MTTDEIENEIFALAAETLALQVLLTQVLNNLTALGPAAVQAIEHGFDDAARILEIGADKFGKTASPKHTLGAIEIVDKLRESIFPSHSEPKHDV